MSASGVCCCDAVKEDEGLDKVPIRQGLSGFAVNSLTTYYGEVGEIRKEQKLLSIGCYFQRLDK